jgi:hypothetical protein
MARRIDADFSYANWYEDWDWVGVSSRAIIKWGSPNDFKFTPNYKQSDLQLGYEPSQSVEEIFWQYQMRKFRAEMGYRAVVLQALWKWRFGSSGRTGTFDCRMHAFIKAAGYPDLDDCDAQYRDIGDTNEWYGSAYSPQCGQDITTAAVAQANLDQTGLAQGDFFANSFDISDYFAQQLLDNEDLWLEMFQITSSSAVFIGTSVAVERPAIDIHYFFPVEMFPQKEGGGSPEIDLERLLNTDNEPISLGAYQKGETGTAQRFYLKNFSRQTIAHIEVHDDYPEWTVPVADPGNGGSGVLAYVEPFENCVSQRWEVKFSSASAFEVKATSYLDNLESLHPSYDADTTWQGTTASDFDSPDGSIRIPSAAWSGTPNTDDLFVFYTRGQTTNTAWPADSNDQVQMAEDNAGTPEKWRPITGQRTELTVSDTVDAATITVTVKRIDTTKWPVNNEVYLADPTNIDKGTIKSVTATTIEIENLSITNNVYAIGAIVATTLPVRGLVGAAWAQVTAASGVSQAQKDRIYIDDADTYGFTDSETVFIQSLADPDTNEEAVIQSVTSTYIDLSSDMVNDYEVGATVSEIGSGEQIFWLRVVADPATQEEKKEFRLNVIA